MTVSNKEENPYSNKYQQRVVEELHRRKKATAVCACSNSEIEVYLDYGTLYTESHQLDPYDVAYVRPLPETDEFQCKVTLRADWTEVEFDEEKE